jgi:hypothetical protein
MILKRLQENGTGPGQKLSIIGTGYKNYYKETAESIGI